MKKTFVVNSCYSGIGNGTVTRLSEDYNLPEDLRKRCAAGGMGVKITFEYEVEGPKPKLGDNYRLTGDSGGGSINLAGVVQKTKCRNGVFIGGTHEYPRVAFFVFAQEIAGIGQISQTGPTGLVWDPNQPRAAAKVGQKIRAIKVVSENNWVLVEGRIFEGRKIIVDRTDNPKVLAVGQVFDCEGLPMVGIPE